MANMGAETVMNFSHNDRSFSVSKAGSDMVTFSILDEQKRVHGVIEGLWREQTETFTFIPTNLMNRNKLAAPAYHVPYLVGTTIGELVAQSGNALGKGLVWLSSGFTTSDGMAMYRHLMEETQEVGSRFSGRIIIREIPAHIDPLALGRYLIRPYDTPAGLIRHLLPLLGF